MSVRLLLLSVASVHAANHTPQLWTNEGRSDPTNLDRYASGHWRSGCVGVNAPKRVVAAVRVQYPRRAERYVDHVREIDDVMREWMIPDRGRHWITRTLGLLKVVMESFMGAREQGHQRAWETALLVVVVEATQRLIGITRFDLPFAQRTNVSLSPSAWPTPQHVSFSPSARTEPQLTDCLSFCAGFEWTLDHASPPYYGLYGAHDDPLYHGAYGDPQYVQSTYGSDNFVAAQCKVECMYADGDCGSDYSSLGDATVAAQATRMCRYANALTTGETRDFVDEPFDCTREADELGSGFACQEGFALPYSLD